MLSAGMKCELHHQKRACPGAIIGMDINKNWLKMPRNKMNWCNVRLITGITYPTSGAASVSLQKKFYNDAGKTKKN